MKYLLIKRSFQNYMVNEIKYKKFTANLNIKIVSKQINSCEIPKE